MIFLASLLGIPLTYLATLVILATKRDARGFGVSIVLFVGTALAGLWDISQSRSSTAGIGFLFLPLTASVAGFCGLAFGRWRHGESKSRAAAAWIALGCGVAVIAITLIEGRKTIAKNRIRDNKQAEFSAEIARDRVEITAALSANPGRQRAWLDSAIRTRINDRAFLLAALPNDSVSPASLDTVTYSGDLNVTLEAIRNPNARPKTLTRVYQTASYPDYFFQALAAHRSTPPEILREIYTQPRTIGGLDIWFAGNPSTPKDILTTIAGKTTDPNVVNALLENPGVDCPTMTALARNLMKKQNRNADNPSVETLTKRLPTVCDNTPAG